MDQPIIGITTEPNLVSHVLAIFTVLQQEHGMETLTENSPDVRALIEKLRITPVQAVLFSIVLNIQNDHSVSVGDIAKSIKAPSLMIVQYQAEIDSLVEKRLFRVYQGYPGRAAPAVGEGSLKTYRVPKNIIDAISHNEEWSPPSHTDLRFEDFFGILDNLFEQKIDNTISIDTLKFEISHLMRENPHLEFVEKVEGFGLSDDDLLVFLIFCNQAVDSDQKISFHMISSIYTRSRAMRMWREIVNENSTLQKLSLIESANNDGLGDDRFFTLTRKIKDDLLGDIVPKNPLGKKPKGWLSYKDIKAKELIYNEAEGERLSKLQKLLDKEQFQNVISRLESSNMRLGFACLFSGCPGTGKTESVLQIARCTQRDIFKVDISETKTKWFGESEKRIKEVFDRYRGLINSARKNQENIPILFFNEADGVFSKRQIIGGERTGPAQILQHLSPESWWEEYIAPHIKDRYNKDFKHLDFLDLINILFYNWNTIKRYIKKNYSMPDCDRYYTVIDDMHFIRNFVSHTREAFMSRYKLVNHLSTILDFAQFIHADEKLIVLIEKDLKKYEEEYYLKGDESEKNINREELIKLIQSEVLSKAIDRDDLPPDIKASVRRTLMRIKYMKTTEEILGFFNGALKSSRGHEVSHVLHTHGLKAFVDLADEINEKYANMSSSH